MAKWHLKLVSPATVNRTVRPRRPPNSDLRTREYLTDAEVERMMKAATRNRWGHRDATMILVAYRHGLRVSELVDLRWDQADFRTATLHVRRVKQGTPSTHPILGDELRALRRLQREQEPKSPFVFTSERGAPFSTAGFARMVERAGDEAKFAFKAHPHMLRHACGYALARQRHRAGEAILCVSQEHGASLKVHIFPAHREQLAASHPRLDGQLDNRRKPTASRGFTSRQ
jgi:integrase